MKFLKRLFCKHTQTKIVERWIEVKQKSNKPSETFLSVDKFCLKCGEIILKGYFTEEEIKKDLQS